MTEEIPIQFFCPICLEIPDSEIFQCVNGHTICTHCIDSLEECPQCRIKYGKEKIRNRILEELLDTRKFHCPNESFGCGEQMGRVELAVHTKSCTFGAQIIQLCKSMGYNCEFSISSRNIPAAVQHFQDKHEAVNLRTNSGKILLVDFPLTQFHKSSVWTPHILQNDEFQYLVFVKMNGVPQTMSLICIHLADTSKITDKYTVKFAICSDNQPKMEWTTYPVGLQEAELYVTAPYLQIPGNVLKRKFLTEGSLQVMVWILPTVAETRTDVKPLENSDEASFAFNDVPVDPDRINSASLVKDNESRTVTTIVCEGCQVKAPKGTWHKCLQCKDYNLCDTCWRGKKDHAHHFFVAIRNELELVAIGKLKWDNAAQDKRPLITKDVFIEGPIECFRCKVAGDVQPAKYTCLICPTLYSLCSNCFYKRRDICKSHNFFTLSK